MTVLRPAVLRLTPSFFYFFIFFYVPSRHHPSALLRLPPLDAHPAPLTFFASLPALAKFSCNLVPGLPLQAAVATVARHAAG